ncbi:MAG: hypothetical protein ACTSVZ_10755 [Promethearchaeota archaeon]
MFSSGTHCSGRVHPSSIRRRRPIFGFFLMPMFMMFFFMAPVRNLSSIFPILFIIFVISLIARAFRPRSRVEYEEPISTAESSPPSQPAPPKSPAPPSPSYHVATYVEVDRFNEALGTVKPVAVSRFCPSCGNPFSDSDQEVLRNQHFIFCSYCGYKNES